MLTEKVSLFIFQLSH